MAEALKLLGFSAKGKRRELENVYSFLRADADTLSAGCGRS